MEEHIVRILGMEPVTHNVIRFTVEKPEGYKYIPGQATEVSVNLPGWETEKRPFTFTSLNKWPHLEFTIKIYGDHDGVTRKLGTLTLDNTLILRDMWGAIHYQGEGVFIAGGAGVTPFIAIFRQLQEDKKLGNNLLVFSNRTSRDIILEQEFSQMLGKRFINTLTDEPDNRYDHGRIDKQWLKSRLDSLDRKYYICGPDPMVSDLKATLASLGVEQNAVTVEL